MLVLTWVKPKLSESEFSLLQLFYSVTPSYPSGLMLNMIHSCQYPQVVIQGVFFCGISTTNSCLCKFPFVKWPSKKKKRKEFSLLTLENRETDNYKCLS